MHHGKSNMDVRTRPSAVRSDGSMAAFFVALYNQGYKAGHLDTVESQYVDICESDMRTYHADVVMQICAEANSGIASSQEAGR